ncbi:MAG TPA: SRPBCC family protein [Polyangiaceae bacterium]|nr:SRPBCC family protein [Polyangiaceae bacterium]
MAEERSSKYTWALDREIVLSRVFDAPRELVFRAWTEQEHFAKWFGPRGFTTTIREADMRVGGLLRFDMQAPDGKLYDNRIEFLEIKRPELLVYDHGSDKDDDADRFRVTITFDEQSDKKTVMTMRSLQPTKEQRAIKIGFGAVELGYQTLDKLAEHLRSQT